jgi:hypothetical protein
VDFCILENGKAVSLYQVCYDIADFDTRDREVHTLRRVGKRLGIFDLNLIIGNTDLEIEEKGIKIIRAIEIFD